MSAKPLIEFRDASLGYGRKAVLQGVTLSVMPGQFWGILGHNGSGKTTMLKTLLGLIPPLRGQLAETGTMFGQPRFGYVPQKEKLDAIYPLTSYAVASMGAYRKVDLLAWLRGSRADALVRRCLKECGATDFGQRQYSELSGGQRQRVLIARALAAEPELLVLDEPLSGIDITTQRAILELLKRLKEDKGLTILMVSHRIQAEKDLFTHIAWVDEGKVQAGPAAQILAHSHVREVFRSEL